MKERFSTIDLLAVVEYFNRRLLGMRAANIYDIDHKTYLIKLAKSEEKAMLLFESGCRIHTTEFDWPKNMMPSGFAMKLRKHLRTKRLTAVCQLGVDRVVDLQFGSGDHTHHLIIELYDRGNVILTDHTYTILSLLRVRTDTDMDVRFAIREIFSMDTIKHHQPLPTKEQIQSILSDAKPGDQLKHVLNPHFVFGPALLTHCIVGAGLPENAKIGTHVTKDNDSNIELILSVLIECHSIFKSFQSTPCKGYLIQKKETGAVVGTEDGNELVTNVEFHPMLFRHHCSTLHVELESFNKAVDQFFSSKTSQKQDVKAHQMQKTAVKKLENIQQDHQRRLQALKQAQDEDMYKANLIEVNTDLVEKACLVIRSAIASSMDWGDIDLLVRDAQARHDPVACCIHGLKLQSNQITLLLKDPFDSDDEDEVENDRRSKVKKSKKLCKVDIDLGISAYANAQKYYKQKKSAATKEQKTIDSSKKALKSAEKKAKQTLKEAAVVSRIQKARKVLWFEKFYWFISSENYLVIGGRDQQQNELIVKKYLNDNDLYVHADLHGATSVVIKNPNGGPVPPKTLNESGVMAVCYSSAWEAKIISSSWWVYANQVSKTAPSGEYLTTGSFMIRGKKNFLPPCQLSLGFSVMFKLDDSCIGHHLNERKAREVATDDLSSVTSDVMSEVTIDEVEVEVDEIENDGELERGLEEDADHLRSHSPTKHETESSENESDEEDDDGCGYIDTAIQIQSKKDGIKFELQRSTSNMSSASSVTDANPLQYRTTEDLSVKPGHRHLSAKERRILKKKGKGDEESGQVNGGRGVDREERTKVEKKNEHEMNNVQYKRGKKSKQKKIREKYWDQDDEERIMKMEILASSGGPKETKSKKGKGKKGDLGQSFNPKAKYNPKQKEKSQQPAFVERHQKQLGPTIVNVTTDKDVTNEVHAHLPSSDIHAHLPPDIDTNVSSSNKYDSTTVDAISLATDEEISPTVPMIENVTAPKTVHTGNSSLEPVDNDPDLLLVTDVINDMTVDSESDNEEKKAILAEERLLQIEELDKNSKVIDTLTGSPIADDLLLFAIPVCAPYSALHDYKYKVKLVPGTNRRGKAAKTAVHKFMQMKESEQLEKDLLRSIKDNDLSRYFPGKVKMTIPQQISRTKHK